MKTCRRCQKPKDDSEFGVNRYFRDGRAIYCRQCNREHTARQKARAKELFRTTKVKVSYAVLGYHP